MIAYVNPRQFVMAGSVWLLASSGLTAGSGAWASDHKPVAVVDHVQGQVVAERAGVATPLTAGAIVSRFDRLITGVAARLALTFKDGSRLLLGENGAVTIEDWRPEQGRSSGALMLDQDRGALRLTAPKASKAPDKRIELRTPSAVVTVRGTDVWMGPIDDATAVIVLSGAIDVRNNAGSVLLDRAHQGTLVRSRDSAPERARGFGADQIIKAMATTDLR
jgi:hypothetical protein